MNIVFSPSTGKMLKLRESSSSFGDLARTYKVNPVEATLQAFPTSTSIIRALNTRYGYAVVAWHSFEGQMGTNAPYPITVTEEGVSL